MADETVKPPEEQTKEELAATIAAEQARVATEATTEEPAKPETKVESKTYEFRAADGTLYTGESQDELFKKVTGALDNTKLAMKDRERQIHELRNPKPEKSDEKKDGFDKQTYYKMLEEDPIAAQRYLDKHRFGIDNPDEIIRKAAEHQHSAQVAEGLKRELLDFYASPAGQAYAKVETPELNAALIRYMDENRIPRNAFGFRTAYYEMKDQDQIPTPGEKAKKRTPPPRSPEGSGISEGEPEPDYGKMSKDELRKFLRSKGMEVNA